MPFPTNIKPGDGKRSRLSIQIADITPMFLARWLPNGGIIWSRHRSDKIFIGNPSGFITPDSDVSTIWNHEVYRVNVANGFWEYQPPMTGAPVQNPPTFPRAATKGFDLVTLAAHIFREPIENAEAYVRSLVP
jgi:hypothetical protein